MCNILLKIIISFFQTKVWKTLEADPIFSPLKTPIPCDQEKILTAKQLVKYINTDLFKDITCMPYKDKV